MEILFLDAPENSASCLHLYLLVSVRYLVKARLGSYRRCDLFYLEFVFVVTILHICCAHIVVCLIRRNEQKKQIYKFTNDHTAPFYMQFIYFIMLPKWTTLIFEVILPWVHFILCETKYGLQRNIATFHLRRNFRDVVSHFIISWNVDCDISDISKLCRHRVCITGCGLSDESPIPWHQLQNGHKHATDQRLNQCPIYEMGNKQSILS